MNALQNDKYNIDNIDLLLQDEFISLLDSFSHNYHNSELDELEQHMSSVSDDTFDSLLDIYKNKYGIEYKKVGSNPIDSYKETLPKYMGSLNKLKTENEINRWSKKYRGNFIISDKIDGISALYNGEKLWTRGNGVVGTNISHILKYLNLPYLKNGLVRGELVLSKQIFETKYKSKMSNARNMTSGLINPLTKIPNTNALYDLVFLAYEFDDFTYTQSQSVQLSTLTSLGFKIPTYKTVSSISVEDLKTILINRKTNSEFEIDGIVITHDQPTVALQQENPDHSVAFKMEGECVITTVKGVEWNASKHNVLKPRINIETVVLTGVEINWATGHNAKFIYDNGIGRGALVKITRSGDVIPYIKEIITPVVPEMPDEHYVWNSTNVDIVLTGENDEVKKRRIVEFFKCLEAKFIGKSTIDTLYTKLHIDTLKKYFNLKEKDISSIEGIRDKKAHKIIDAIQNSIKNVDIVKLASASGTFGIGFGEKKLRAIFQTFPHIIDMDVSESTLTEMIKGIKGFDKTSHQFSKNLYLFKKFLKEHPEIELKKEYLHIIKESSEENREEEKSFETTKSFEKTIVFTGTRDKVIEEEIEKRGGKITSSVSKNTDILITSKRYSNSSKEIKAYQLEKEILTLEEFKIKYNF